MLNKSKLKNLFLILFTLFLMALYFPINRLVTGGYELKLPLDNSIPLIPTFIIPYLFGLIFWLGFIIYTTLYQDSETFKRVMISFSLAAITSSLIYIIFPTFVSRPEVTGTDTFSNLITWLYSSDRANNAFPSGHTFYTLITCIYLTKLFPKYKLVWIIIGVLIIASTLFTKQHYLLDVVGGIVLGFLIVRLQTKN
jgi:membrane-associated phospholipid phosphatase